MNNPNLAAFVDAFTDHQFTSHEEQMNNPQHMTLSTALLFLRPPFKFGDAEQIHAHHIIEEAEQLAAYLDLKRAEWNNPQFEIPTGERSRARLHRMTLAELREAARWAREHRRAGGRRVTVEQGDGTPRYFFRPYTHQFTEEE